MNTVTIHANQAGRENNATILAVKALKQLQESEDGLLSFEKGEYHFYQEGTIEEFFAVSNNSAGTKSIAFFINKLHNLTLEGNHSVFVFHELAFPFVIEKSSHITLKDITLDRAFYPQAIMKVAEVTNEGFLLEIDPKENPYFIKNGALFFKREWGVYSGQEKIFSLHATGDRFHVQYLITGECTEAKDHLPATFLCVDAEETENGVFFRYRKENKYTLEYAPGETITSILDGRRDIDLIFINQSSDITLSNLTVRRGVGMGVIGQLSKNIEVDHFSTDSDFHHEYSSLTADALHFVHCSGQLTIHHCKIEKTSDDVVNVHGMYTVVNKIEKDTIYASIKHQEQRKFLPYERGDRLEIIDPHTFKTAAEFLVESACFENDCGDSVKISGRFVKSFAEIQPEYLVEIPDKMPDLHLYNNVFNRYPHMRLSGAGTMVVENNRFSNSGAALLAQDLSKYWYESGRIKNLIFRNNLMDCCNRLFGENFIFIGVDGVAAQNCPKIHHRVEITENTFKNIKKRAIYAYAVEDLVIRDNVYENTTDELVVVDGKVQG